MLILSTPELIHVVLVDNLTAIYYSNSRGSILLIHEGCGSAHSSRGSLGASVASTKVSGSGGGRLIEKNGQVGK